jgi:hypothetical protein
MMLFDLLKARSDIEDAKSLKQRLPVPRPHRDPTAETLNWKTSGMQISEQGSQLRTKNFVTTFSGKLKLFIYVNLQTFLDGAHCCKLPFDKLKPIKLRNMQVPKIHNGYYLVCKVVGAPHATISTNVLVEDLNGKFCGSS